MESVEIRKRNMMSVSEFFSSDPEPPWIVDAAADLESYTDMNQLEQEHSEASTSTAPTTMMTSGASQFFAGFSFLDSSSSRSSTDMEIDDMPSTSSNIDRVIAHLFTLREIESVRPFRIDDPKGTGGARRHAAGRSKASRKRKFDQIL